MKRFPAFLLLLVLSLAGTMSAKPQRISPQQNAHQSKKAIKKQQRMLKKANKKQAKAQKKYAKKQQKETKKNNRALRRRRT
ncbi:MAG: hypothetical protein WAK29_18545 [Terriglobales bacterium]